ncbi:MAG: hypothetical protein QOC99_1284 [Acidobacteriota bacterium]|jgi:hypothetical protein|nr:hypothetical protein [Acidobacteriota bacterium]
MAELEVENTLREIRERVLADAGRRAPTVAAASVRGMPPGLAPGADESAGGAGEALARMDANLSTTGRAWSRLPPLLSYRRGRAARLELWLKRQVKRATHWFTWEQVNFNSAAHHALGDARSALAAHEHALERLQSELAASLVASLRDLRAEAEQDRSRVSELHARLARAEAHFDAGAAQLRETLAAGIERLVEEQRALAAALREGLREEQRAQIHARAAELRSEMHDRVDGLLEEQRVCFKQLSLETGEAAVMHDRARRQIEARLEELEKKAVTSEK